MYVRLLKFPKRERGLLSWFFGETKSWKEDHFYTFTWIYGQEILSWNSKSTFSFPGVLYIHDFLLDIASILRMKRWSHDRMISPRCIFKFRFSDVSKRCNEVMISWFLNNSCSDWLHPSNHPKIDHFVYCIYKNKIKIIFP